MKFLFDCEDEIALPAAYNLVSDIKPFLEKLAAEGENEGDIADKREARKAKLNRMLKNAMVLHPTDTGKLLAKLWVLEDGETAPNTFKTMATLFANEVAVDFFTSVLPSLLQLSKEVWPLLTSSNSVSTAGTTSKSGA